MAGCFSLGTSKPLLSLEFEQGILEKDFIASSPWFSWAGLDSLKDLS